MAFGGLIQSVVGKARDDSPTATLPGAITEGNLLIVIYAVDDGIDLSTLPTGFAEDVVLEDTVNGLTILSKIAGASESTTISGTMAASDSWVWIIAEFEGPYESTQLDKTVSLNDGSLDTDKSTGTAETAQADELLIAAWCTQDGDPPSENPAVTNSFTLHEAESISGQLGDPGGFLASRVVTATGTFESTLSWDTTSSRGKGVMATYKKEAGAPAGRVMGALAGHGGLAGAGGLAGVRGGLAG